MRSEKDKDDPYGVLGPGSGGPVSTLDFERSLLSPLLSPLSLERVLLVRRPMGARGPAPWCSTSANRRRRGRRFHERVMWREREGGRERLATGVVALAQSQKPRKGRRDDDSQLARFLSKGTLASWECETFTPIHHRISLHKLYCDSFASRQQCMARHSKPISTALMVPGCVNIRGIDP